MNFLAKSLIALALVFSAQSTWAQDDEIIVTATRADNNNSPGIFLEKRGDFLLLQVIIENDSRDLPTRLAEMDETMQGIIAKAKANPEIFLSQVDGNDFVRPLSLESFKQGIRTGRRPDTSIAFLKVKTEIPDDVVDSYKLANKLGRFIDGLKETGRTKIETNSDVDVSVVAPEQYRQEVMTLVIDEINLVTNSLGPNYRAIIKGMDRELGWVRSGDLNLAFYLPYSYEIIPDTLNAYTVQYIDE